MSDTNPRSRDQTYKRTFNAPRELVFRCMTEAEHLTHFWGPAGTSAPLEDITVDLRPGGAFETVMVNESAGVRYPTKAVFVEIVDSEKLVWFEPDRGMTTTIFFEDVADGRTEVRVVQSNVPEEFRGPEARAGFTSSLDRLAEYLERL